MMRFIDFFEEIYIVNLPHRSDRRKDTELALRRVKIFVDNKKVLFFPAVKPESAGEFPSIGARGCFMSHLAILKQAKEKGLKNLLVLEDDIEFNDVFLESEASIVDSLQQKDWDFVTFAYNDPKVLTVPEGVSLVNHAELYPWHRPATGSHCVAFNGRVLSDLIAYLELLASRPKDFYDGCPMHIDGAYNCFRFRNSAVIRLISIPSIATQRSSRSDIANLSWFDKLPFIRIAANFARRLFRILS